MSSRRELLIIILALLQIKTLLWNKKSQIKMLKTAPFDCAINEKCCSVDGERGICLIFSSHPGGFDSSARLSFSDRWSRPSVAGCVLGDSLVYHALRLLYKHGAAFALAVVQETLERLYSYVRGFFEGDSSSSESTPGLWQSFDTFFL